MSIQVTLLYGVRLTFVLALEITKRRSNFPQKSVLPTRRSLSVLFRPIHLSRVVSAATFFARANDTKLVKIELALEHPQWE